MTRKVLRELPALLVLLLCWTAGMAQGACIPTAGAGRIRWTASPYRVTDASPCCCSRAIPCARRRVMWAF